MHSALLDTGVLVALMDQSEKKHDLCVGFLEDFQGELLTTEPVLTEAIHLLGYSVKAQLCCIEFLLDEEVTIVPQSAQSLSRVAVLMEKYQDIPMDFADATLVVLAEETGIREVLTLDIRGFHVYRIHGRKHFKVLPDPY